MPHCYEGAPFTHTPLIFTYYAAAVSLDAAAIRFHYWPFFERAGAGCFAFHILALH